MRTGSESESTVQIFNISKRKRKIDPCHQTLAVWDGSRFERGGRGDVVGVRVEGTWTVSYVHNAEPTTRHMSSLFHIVIVWENVQRYKHINGCTVHQAYCSRKTLSTSGFVRPFLKNVIRHEKCQQHPKPLSAGWLWGIVQDFQAIIHTTHGCLEIQINKIKKRVVEAKNSVHLCNCTLSLSEMVIFFPEVQQL